VYYFDEANILQKVSPDIMVVRGVEKKERRIYKVDEEGKAPDVAIELTSASTKLEDLGNKRAIYAFLGVQEYYLFDPYNEILEPQLRGYRLKNGDYMPMIGDRFLSKALGLELRKEDNWLRLYDSKSGERLRTPAESEAVAKQERKSRLAAEAEITHLREELAKLRGNKK